jgi:hypothetical protein
MYSHLIIAPLAWSYLDEERYSEQYLNLGEHDQVDRGPYLIYTPNGWLPEPLGPHLFPHGDKLPDDPAVHERCQLMQRIIRLGKIIDLRGYMPEDDWLANAANSPGSHVELARVFCAVKKWDSQSLYPIKAPRVVFVPIGNEPQVRFQPGSRDGSMVERGTNSLTSNIIYDYAGSMINIPARKSFSIYDAAMDLRRAVFIFPDWENRPVSYLRCLHVATPASRTSPADHTLDCPHTA